MHTATLTSPVALSTRATCGSRSARGPSFLSAASIADIHFLSRIGHTTTARTTNDAGKSSCVSADPVAGPSFCGTCIGVAAKLCSWRGLNPRPSVHKTNALTNCATRARSLPLPRKEFTGCSATARFPSARAVAPALARPRPGTAPGRTPVSAA